MLRNGKNGKFCSVIMFEINCTINRIFHIYKHRYQDNQAVHSSKSNNRDVSRSTKASNQSFAENPLSILKRGKVRAESVAPLKKNDLQIYLEDEIEETDHHNPLQWWKVK